jgi:hypothetical protein
MLQTGQSFNGSIEFAKETLDLERHQFIDELISSIGKMPIERGSGESRFARDYL